MDWLRLLGKTASAVAGLAGIALALVYFLQEKILYVPRLPGVSNEYPHLPDAFQLRYEDVWLTTSDGLRLHAWLMSAPELSEQQRRAAPTVIFCQENAGNMAWRLHFIKRLCYHLRCNAFIFSYRGYGRSQGTPSEQGLQLDVECAVDYVLGRADLNAQRIVLFGRSLGGAVAAHAAARRRPQVSGLVLENTFTRIVDLVPHKLPLLKPLVGPGKLCNFLVRNHWDTKARLQQLKDLPILFLSSLRDTMLPPSQMLELYALHPAAPWSMKFFDDGQHLDTYETDAAQYWPAVQQFVDHLPAPEE
ncbi:Alpha/beta hydrolase domain-containing protein WAV2 [Chlorella vulgaris]